MMDEGCTWYKDKLYSPLESSFLILLLLCGITNLLAEIRGIYFKTVNIRDGRGLLTHWIQMKRGSNNLDTSTYLYSCLDFLKAWPLE